MPRPVEVIAARAAFNSSILTPAEAASGATVPKLADSSGMVVRPALTVLNRISETRPASLPDKL